MTAATSSAKAVHSADKSTKHTVKPATSPTKMTFVSKYARPAHFKAMQLLGLTGDNFEERYRPLIQDLSSRYRRPDSDDESAPDEGKEVESSTESSDELIKDQLLMRCINLIGEVFEGALFDVDNFTASDYPQPDEWVDMSLDDEPDWDERYEHCPCFELDHVSVRGADLSTAEVKEQDSDDESE